MKIQEKKKVQLPKQIELNFMKTFSIIDLYRYVFKVCSDFKHTASLFNLAAFLNLHKSRLIICQKQDYFISNLRKVIESSNNWQIYISTAQLDKLKELILQRITSFQNLLFIIHTVNCFTQEIIKKLKLLYEHLKKFSNILNSYNQIQQINTEQKQKIDCHQISKNNYCKNLKVKNAIEYRRSSQKNDNQTNLNNNKSKDIKKINNEKNYIQKIIGLKKQYKTYKTLNNESQKQFFQNEKSIDLKQEKQKNSKYIVKNKILMTEFNQFSQNQDNEMTKIQIKMNKSKLSSTFYQTNSMFSNISFHQSFSKVKNSFKLQNYQNKNVYPTQAVNQERKKQQKKVQKTFNFLRKGVSKSITLNSSIQDSKYQKIKGNSFIQKSFDILNSQTPKSYFRKQSFTDNNLNVTQIQQIRKKKYKLSKTMCFPNKDQNNLFSLSIQKTQNINKSISLKQQQAQQQIQEKNYKYNSKLKNRRKGFSKKRIESQDQQQVYQNKKKKNQLTDQNIKNQRNYNRTSFFRTSGYIQKQNIENLQKSKFNKSSPFRKKQNRQQSQEKLCPQDELILQQNLELNKHSSHKKKTYKDANNQQNISLKDIYQLSKDIIQQDKNHHQHKYTNYMNDLLRSKYATYQNQRIDQDAQSSAVENLNKRLRVMQSQMQHRVDKIVPNWFIQNLQSIKLSQKFIKCYNQLGQKQLSKENNNSNFFNWKQDFI